VESPHPYFHPLRSPSGDVVTIVRPHDHVWHKGLSFVVAHVDGENFWGGPSYVRESDSYEWLPNNGSMRTIRMDAVEHPSGVATIVHDLEWVTSRSERLIADARRITIASPADDHWVLSFEITLTNLTTRPLAFGSPTTNGREAAGYGGLFWRGPRSFTDGIVTVGGVAGGDNLMGARGRWASFTGRHDGSARESTVLIVDTGSEDEQQWFARTGQFAGLCAAPFFSTESTVPAGGSARFSYAAVIADGRCDDARVSTLLGSATEFARAAA
jgi:hypothetical protein